MRKQGGRDRRIEKTERALCGALGTLMDEKAYEDIAVKEILGRANVGRTTFYTHFGDKDELLLSCIHDMLGSRTAGAEWSPAGPHERVLWFSLPIFERIEQHRQRGHGTPGPPGRRAMHEHLQDAISKLIEHEVEAAFRGPPGRHPPPELVVRWIASTFVLVLNWWVEGEHPLPAGEADRLFRGLVEPWLAATAG